MKYVLILLIAIALLFTACGEKAGEKMAERLIEKAIEKNSDEEVDVDLSGDNVEIKTKDGTTKFSSGREVAIPDDFPSDVFVYKDVEIGFVASENENYSLTMTSNDNITKVLEEYKKKFEKDGWKVETSLDMGDAFMYQYTKGERRISLSLSADGEETFIIQAVSK